MKYEDVIKDGKFVYSGKPVTEEGLVRAYAEGLITESDYLQHYQEYKND